MAQPKILLAEDDAGLVEMYKIRFSAGGYELVTAGDGEEALTLIKQEKPDLILLDIMMPKLDGFAVLTELRKDKNFKTPVIMLSNLGQDSDIEKGKELGAVDYIVKANCTPTQVFEKAIAVIKK